MLSWLRRRRRPSPSLVSALSPCLSIPSTVVTVEESGEAILLDQDAGQYFGLNETALFIWRALLKHTQRSAMIEQYCEAFGLEMGQAERDVDSLIKALQTRLLLEKAS